jgi:RNA polymerase sigma-70 factor (ECF subfamily)
MPGDERVLSLLAAGDRRQAATEVIRAHGPAALRYQRAHLRDEGAAEDAFSLFAEWAWEAIERFRGDSSLRTWAFGIAWNAARRVRDEAWRRRRQRLESGEASKLAQEIRTSSALERDRRVDRLKDLRRELSPEEQNLLVLRLDQRLSWEEIAAIISGGGEPVGAAALRKRFERLKERMARLARARGLVRR